MSNSVHFEEIKALCDQNPVFVYPWGCNSKAGFGANYSGMIKTLALCLIKGIGYRFARIRRPRGIAISKGYPDFFVPFCAEVDGFCLQALNINPLPFQARLPLVKSMVSSYLRLATSPRARYFLFSDLLAIPSRALGEHRFQCKDGFQEFRSELARQLWRLAPQIRESVDRIKEECKIASSQYISVVVRRGDKKLEAKYAALEGYVKAISVLSNKHANIFISGDDASAIGELASMLSSFSVSTIRPAFEAGYNQAGFLRLDAEMRMTAMIRFFAQVELMAGADCFVGTKTTNVSYLVRDLIGEDRTVWVD